MQLPIEQWISERYTSKNVIDLFKESVICYRNGAYRASLLLSYIGFVTIIKELLLASQPATNFEDSEWQSVRRRISNNESWEREVVDCLLQGASGRAKPIFRLTDDLREQITYWRQRRNDAAHYKDNEIGSYHTEGLWSFIRSSVPKMAVNGGKEGLLNKFADHFNEHKTPPGLDYRDLVKEIPLSILVAELPDFILELERRVDSRHWYGNAKVPGIFNEMFNLPNEHVVNALVAYLKLDDRDLGFLGEYPQRLMQMMYSEKELRWLWKLRLLSTGVRNPYPVYCELLRNDLIPIDERKAAHLAWLEKYNQRGTRQLPEAERDIDILIKTGFYQVVYHEAIITRGLNKFMWVNEKCDLLISLFENLPFDDQSVRTICTMAESANPSQWLLRELKNLFERKPSKRQEFVSHLETLQLEMPDELE